MKIDIYKDNVGYVTDEVSTVPVCESNSNEENRIKFVTDLAAISRGKSESNNPKARYLKLLKEAAPYYEHDAKKYGDTKSPSRPVEFLPVVLTCTVTETNLILVHANPTADYPEVALVMTMTDFINDLGRYSYLVNTGNFKQYKVYTNMRACVNAGIPYEKIPYNTKEELVDFVALKAKLPMFVWAQVPNTHTKISKEAQSDRVTTTVDYWLPTNLREKVYLYSKEQYDHSYDYTSDVWNVDDLTLVSKKINAFKNNTTFEQFTNEILTKKDRDSLVSLFVTGNPETGFKPTQHDVQTYLKEIGYPMEIAGRAFYYFKYKEVVMTGWKNDPAVWDHLFLERNAKLDLNKNWTQNETGVFVNAMKEIIETNHQHS